MDGTPAENQTEKGVLPFKPITLHNDAPVDRASDEVDFLNFTPLAKEIAAIAVGTDGPFTMAITAKWGYGKTSMLGLVKDLIGQYGEAKDEEWRATHTTVWFNAWQYEREDEPIVPLLVAIQEALKENLDSNQPNVEKAIPIAWKALKKMPQALGDVASGFKLKSKVETPFIIQLLTGIKSSIEVEADTGKIVEKIRETFAHEKAETLPETTFMHAMTELNAISKELTKAATDLNFADKPKVVVFVDDLDRCHPDAALRLLDGIKLVLNQPGFVFVIALDKTILEEFLVRRYRREYGATNPQDVGRRYIDKIIQLEIPLPPSVGRFEGSDERMRIQPGFAGKGFLERTSFRILEEDYALLVSDVVRHCTYLSPRDVVRILLRLRLDLALYKSCGSPIDNLRLPEVAVAALIMRLVEGAFDSSHRDDFLDLVVDERISERLWRGVSTYFDAEIDSEPPLPEIDEEGALLSQSISRSVRKPRGLVDALAAHGKQWLTDVMLRRRLLEFLDPDADKVFGDLDQFTLVQNAVRRVLNLRRGEPIPRDWSQIEVLVAPPELTDEGLQFIARCTGIKTLVLSGSKVKNLYALRDLKNLTELDISNTAVDNLAPLGDLSGMVSLLLMGSLVSASKKASLSRNYPRLIIG